MWFMADIYGKNTEGKPWEHINDYLQCEAEEKRDSIMTMQ